MNPAIVLSNEPFAIQYCSTCDKPFTNQSSYARHTRYCGSRIRSRPRSCRACNSAKSKCSFQIPCSRCKKRDIECIYDRSAAVVKRVSQNASQAPRSVERDVSPDIRTQSADVEMLPVGEFDFPNWSAADGAFEIFGGKAPYVDLSLQTSLFATPLDVDDLLAFDPNQHHYLTDAPVTLFNLKDPDLKNWCKWTRRGDSLAVITENPVVVRGDSTLPAAKLPAHAQYHATFVIQSLRSIPAMMLRRETFPWFIHRHTEMICSKSNGTCLPEALSACMSIAQLFAARTYETKPFLWKTIRSQYRHFTDQMSHMDKYEVLAALQACCVYFAMCVIDYSPEIENYSLELLLGLHDLFITFKEICQACSTEADLLNPDSSWADWIFVESQRRLGSLWFLIGCAVSVKNNKIYDSGQSYRSLLLPSPKTVWEARTEAAWAAEYEACFQLQASGLETLGNLLDVQKVDYTPANAQKLDKWNAGVDNLGSLLNLVGSMI